MEKNKFYNHIAFRMLISVLQSMYLGLLMGWWGLLISVPIAIWLGWTAD